MTYVCELEYDSECNVAPCLLGVYSVSLLLIGDRAPHINFTSLSLSSGFSLFCGHRWSESHPCMRHLCNPYSVSMWKMGKLGCTLISESDNTPGITVLSQPHARHSCESWIAHLTQDPPETCHLFFYFFIQHLFNRVSKNKFLFALATW